MDDFRKLGLYHVLKQVRTRTKFGSHLTHPQIYLFHSLLDLTVISAQKL